MFPYNKSLVSNAQALRKNMTPEEKHLWYDFLKRVPVTVKRQHNIGNYILDFYIASKKIAIEIDGMQHQTEDHRKKDAQRDQALAEWGIRVLRYTNEDVNQSFLAVTKDILDHLNLTFADLKEQKKRSFV